MARTAFTPTTTIFSGIVLPAPAAVDAVNGNSFTNPTGRAILEVTNGAGSPMNVTITTFNSYSTGAGAHAVTDEVTAVTNGTTKVFGPFDKTLYNDATGNVLVDWSSGTTITARVIETGPV